MPKCDFNKVALRNLKVKRNLSSSSPVKIKCSVVADDSQLTVLGCLQENVKSNNENNVSNVWGT